MTQTKEQKRVWAKEYYQKNKEKINEYNKEWVNNNSKHRKKYMKEYFSNYNQRPYVKKYQEEYRQRPVIKSHRMDYFREYFSRRLKVDKNFLLLSRLRARFITAIIVYSKTGKVMSSRKYRIDYRAIIEHLKPFPKDIENYHVDHIIPLSRFDFNNPEHIKLAFAPSNHQWLTIKENLEKGNRLIIPHYNREIEIK